MDYTTNEAYRRSLIEEADYFTVIRRRNCRNERWEFKTLIAALTAAHLMLEDDPEARFMIYAVKGIHDTWVHNVMKE